MTQLFVTGASGYVGGHVVRALKAQAFEIYALFRQCAVEGTTPIIGNLNELEGVARVNSQLDGIIHLASTRSHNPNDVMKYDVNGSANLLGLWRNGPFIYASSQTVYGKPQRIMDETHPTSTETWYDYGKVSTEQMVELYSETDGRGPGISLRLALLFGTRKKSAGEQFLDLIINTHKRGARLLVREEKGLLEGGSVFIGGNDLGLAFVAALGLEKGGQYNIASGFCTWYELITALNHHTGLNMRLEVLKAGETSLPEDFILPSIASHMPIDKFSKESGWTPHEGLDTCVEAYCKSINH